MRCDAMRCGEVRCGAVRCGAVRNYERKETRNESEEQVEWRSERAS